MRSLTHPDLETVPLTAVLHAPSDPTRLKIVAALAGHEGALPCCEIDLKHPKATLSHHFKVLRQAGVIRVRMEGTQRLNTLRRRELNARFPGLLKSILNAAAAG